MTHPDVRMFFLAVLGAAFAVSCVRLAPKTDAIPPAAVPERFVLCARVTPTTDWADFSLVGETFVRERDRMVCAAVDFRALRGAHRLVWKWYDPAGKLARISDPVSAGEEGFEYDRFLAWDEFPVAGDTPLGRWTVALFVDERFAGAKEFEMTTREGGPLTAARDTEDLVDSDQGAP
ncbi:MAG: hypothetical protein JW843_11115 [Candidatus Aminicenantes bacterium]|nr:hypothetical protein [Candidatus Aminicenantes bacterium]